MSCRLDKFAWSVRLAKTRSQSATAVTKGKIRLNNDSVKPSKEVKPGDTVQLIKHTSTFSYKVIQLLDKRVGAKLVSEYIIDITPPEEVEKLRLYSLAQSGYRQYGTGKPSKKDRRDLDGFLDVWGEEDEL